MLQAGIEYDADPFCGNDKKAVTHTWRHNSELVCIVGLHPDALKASGIEVASVLCHEAVHVWQSVEDVTAMRNPRESWGRESAAYGIENIARELMTAYATWAASVAARAS
jgi:hypothetical protein